MKTGTYKKTSGEIVNVVQVDEENKKVLVYVGDEPYWFGEEIYSTWEAVEPEWVAEKTLEELGESDKNIQEMLSDEPVDIGSEEIADAVKETVEEVPEKSKRKRTPTKPKAKTNKK